MRNRSWMTAWALFAGLGLARLGAAPRRVLRPNTSSTAPRDREHRAARDPDLRPRRRGREGRRSSPPIPAAGSSPSSGQIARGRAAPTREVPDDLRRRLDHSADRDCSFEIILAEPGR